MSKTPNRNNYRKQKIKFFLESASIILENHQTHAGLKCDSKWYIILLIVIGQVAIFLNIINFAKMQN